MQFEKSQPEGKRIMPEIRFTEFSTLSIDPRVGISRSASETEDLYFFIYFCKNCSILFYPITLEGRRGITDEFTTIPIHLVLFSAALVELAKSIPVHS